MGKVLSKFRNGEPGTISRAVDDVVISLRNGSGADIPFGKPVFLKDDGSCTVFNASIHTDMSAFLGFAVCAKDKTPAAYGTYQQSGAYARNELVDILVRGSIVIDTDTSASVGSGVYIRKADCQVVCVADGNNTLQIPNATARKAQDSSYRTEVVLTKANLL